VESIRELLVSNLKRLREEHGYTQAEAAEGAGLSLSGYSQIEYGKTWVSEETLEAFADLYMVSISDLFWSTEQSKSKNDLIVSVIRALPMLNSDEIRQVALLVDSFSETPVSEPGVG
jgi:transcriptional regulator with XRE-family HTH domain